MGQHFSTWTIEFENMVRLLSCNSEDKTMDGVPDGIFLFGRYSRTCDNGVHPFYLRIKNKEGWRGMYPVFLGGYCNMGLRSATAKRNNTILAPRDCGCMFPNIF